MRSSHKLCSLLAAFCLLPSAFLAAGERISFSISGAEPVIVQGKRSAVGFSMHAAEAQTSDTATRNSVAFSVHDAKPLPTDAGDASPVKPDCSPARTVNRVLVIYPPKQTIKVKVCDEFGCRFELRTQPHPILAELKKLSPKWSCGDKECDHFRLVNADDPKQAELLRELDVKRDDLPLLVKETDVEKRKKAAGISAEELAKQWNRWFAAPEVEPEGSGQKAVGSENCLASFQSSRTQWTWPGNIRDHLTDPRQAHHLPRAVVAAWTDAQCVAWDNWHHEVLSGRKPVPSVSHQVPSQTKAVRPILGTRNSELGTRIEAIARSTIRSPPSQMVAAANASYGNSSDAKKAKKKRSTLSRNGSLTSVAACARKSLAESLQNIPSACSTRSRSYPSSA